MYYKLMPTRIRRCEITINDIDEQFKLPEKYLDNKKRETRIYKYLENLVDTKMH